MNRKKLYWVIPHNFKGHVKISDRLVKHSNIPADVSMIGGRFGSVVYAAIVNPDSLKDCSGEKLHCSKKNPNVRSSLIDSEVNQMVLPTR